MIVSDCVATFGETTGYYALKNIFNEMSCHPEGQIVLKDRPRINSKIIDLEKLAQLAPNTFGYNYYHFLKRNKITPDSRKEVRFIDDADLAYVCQRYREIHDLVHCTLMMPTNMLGEVIVKWVEAIQTNLPMCWLGGLFGPIKLNDWAREAYLKEGLPFALNCGYQAKKFMNIYFEKRFEQDFTDLQQELNIPKPPIVDSRKSHI
ncbi:hypothetical protein SSS_02318 [Sarcoptes scabiei]|nr:hypothetical protein SSS_02318 [Sarcoptes scabiei]